jgi:hypothetical protein
MSNYYYNVQKWLVQKYDTGSSTWVSDTSIPRGSVNTFAQHYTSTTQVVTLADGSRGINSPSTKYNYEQLTLSWSKHTVTNAFMAQLQGYITNKVGVKITLHDTSLTKLEGYFMSFNKEWNFTGTTQKYELILEFLPFDVDNSGAIGD